MACLGRINSASLAVISLAVEEMDGKTMDEREREYPKEFGKQRKRKSVSTMIIEPGTRCEGSQILKAGSEVTLSGRRLKDRPPSVSPPLCFSEVTYPCMPTSATATVGDIFY